MIWCGVSHDLGWVARLRCCAYSDVGCEARGGAPPPLLLLLPPPLLLLLPPPPPLPLPIAGDMSRTLQSREYHVNADACARAALIGTFLKRERGCDGVGRCGGMLHLAALGEEARESNRGDA